MIRPIRTPRIGAARMLAITAIAHVIGCGSSGANPGDATDSGLAADSGAPSTGSDDASLTGSSNPDGSASSDGSPGFADAGKPSFQLTAGIGNFCTLASDHSVRCWGDNQTGQLGLGAADEVPHPPPGQPIPGLQATLVRIQAAHACAVTTSGLVCWGSDGAAALARPPSQVGTCLLEDYPCSTTRLAIPGLSAVDGLALSDASTCALTGSSVFCWGLASSGQDGVLSDPSVPYSATPNQIQISDVAEIVASSRTYCARKRTDGSVWCWGDSTHFEIGTSSDAAASEGMHPIPEAIGTLSHTLSIAAGPDHFCAVLADKTVACWGADDVQGDYPFSGELGHDMSIDPLCVTGFGLCNGTPVVVAGLDHVRELALGNFHSCALREDDTVQCWGYNGFDVLGHDPALDTNPMVFTPTPVPGLSNVAHIVSAGIVNCAVTWDDHVWCWGQDDSGTIDLDGDNMSFVPVEIQGF